MVGRQVIDGAALLAVRHARALCPACLGPCPPRAQASRVLEHLRPLHLSRYRCCRRARGATSVGPSADGRREARCTASWKVVGGWSLGWSWVPSWPVPGRLAHRPSSPASRSRTDRSPRRTSPGRCARSWRRLALRGPPVPRSQGPQGSKGDPGPSTGPASGDLAGQFPAPSLGNGVVNAAKFGTIQMVTNEAGAADGPVHAAGRPVPRRSQADQRRRHLRPAGRAHLRLGAGQLA